jgi:hypothetical protein
LGGVGSFTGGLAISTSGTERMRINSTGLVSIGTTSVQTGVAGGGGHVLTVLAPGTADGNRWGVGPTVTFGNFYVVNSSNVGVFLSSGNTAWSAVSDERFKTTLVPFENALTKVSTLRVGTGRYLTDVASVSRSFMIAQDVLAVLPEAVDVGEDEQETLGLRYTEVIPLLTAAIQELKEIVEAQAVEIASLKAK